MLWYDHDDLRKNPLDFTWVQSSFIERRYRGNAVNCIEENYVLMQEYTQLNYPNCNVNRQLRKRPIWML